MNVLVTGGAGFIGSNLVDALIKRGDLVRIIDNLSTGKKEFINPKADFHECDIRDLKRIAPLFEGIDGVFHLGALARIQPSIQDPVSCHEVNALGTLNVLIASRDAKVKKLVYSASSSAYGPQSAMPLTEDMAPLPQNPYAMDKYFGEIMCQVFSTIYHLPTVSLRYFNVYGPRQSSIGAYATVIGIFLEQRKNGEALTIVPDGNQRRDFTYVDDVVRANLLAFASEKVGNGEVLNIGGGDNHSIKEVASMIGGETVMIAPRIGEVRETLAHTARARELLGWETQVSFTEGIERLKKGI